MTQTHLLILLLTLSSALSACSPQRTSFVMARLSSDEEFRQGSCERDAVLLKQNVVVTDQPNGDNFAKLADGQVVYLCSKIAGYQEIVFPDAGEPADCASREADFCLRGYVPEGVQTLLLG